MPTINLTPTAAADMGRVAFHGDMTKDQLIAMVRCLGHTPTSAIGRIAVTAYQRTALAYWEPASV